MCVVDRVYNMVSKRFGVLLVLPFKQLEDPGISGDLQNANVSHVP